MILQTSWLQQIRYRLKLSPTQSVSELPKREIASTRSRCSAYQVATLANLVILLVNNVLEHHKTLVLIVMLVDIYIKKNVFLVVLKDTTTIHLILQIEYVINVMIHAKHVSIHLAVLPVYQDTT